MRRLAILAALVALASTASAQLPRPTPSLGAATAVTCDNGTMALAGSPDTVQECLEALDTQAPPVLRATDCTVQTGVQKQVCQDSDDNSLYVCTTTTCTAAGWFPQSGVLYAADCTALSTAKLGSLCRDSSAPLLDTLWYCSDATCNVANEWKQMGSLALRSGETPAQYRLTALGSANGQDVVVSKCSVASTLDGILCDASSAGGQSVVLAEDSDLGASTLTIGVGATNLSSNYTLGVLADGSMSMPSRLYLPEMGSDPSQPSSGNAYLYLRPQDAALNPDLRLLDDLGYLSRIPLSDVNESNAANELVKRPYANSAYQAKAAGLTWNDTQLDLSASSGDDYLKLETKNATAPTGTDCDAAAEAGRLIARSGASVTDGTSGICVCAVDASSATPAWRCFGTE